MDFVKVIEKIDHFLFFLVNDLFSNFWMDAVFPIFTDLHKSKFMVFVFLPLVLMNWVYQEKGRALKVLAGVILITSFADSMNTHFLKPAIKRERPPSSGVDLILRTDRFGGYSMPSSHATNIFTASSFLAISYPTLRVFFFAIAIAVGYSRPYVGVHFPGDVIVGALLGLLYAFLFSRIYFPACKKLMLYFRK